MGPINKKSPEHFHIMVVDDEKPIRDMIRQNIKRVGYECTTAESGIEALEILASGSKKVDIIITDIRMPDLNGIGLTIKVKENYDSDVIVMTGFADDFDYEKVIESGASDFFQKPINPKELMLRLKRVLKERILLAERNRADKELKKNIEKLQNAQEQTVAALASAAEIRDTYTSGHQKNVSKLSCSIAEHLGLSPELIKGLRLEGYFMISERYPYRQRFSVSPVR